MKALLCLSLAGIVFLSGCASSTTISTAPADAKVYIDGQMVGNTPYKHTDTAVSGATKTVILKKDGYQDKQVTIRKEDAKAGPIIGGIFFLFPFIWTLGYPDSYSFEMNPEVAAGTN